jgi:anti-sigma regulatory factor (Ser/Thr protein kinase)
MVSALSTAIRRRFPCDRSAPGIARAEIRRVALGRVALADAVLVVSELVTNAVRHSGCEAAEEVELMVEFTPAGLRIAVWDVGRCVSGPMLREQGRASGGLGLRVVSELADRWGTDDVSGRRVWAELSPRRPAVAGIAAAGSEPE